MLNNSASKFHKYIGYTAFFLIGLLVILFIYTSYIQIVKSDFLANHPLNHRNIEMTRHIEQGAILDRNGTKLAYSVPDGSNGYKRHYPFGPTTAHITGYSSIEYGKTGIEGSLGGYLSGLSNPDQHLGAITHLLQPTKGNNVSLTIDSHLQQAAYDALGSSRGAIVVLNPRTGEILALASKPSFDPNKINQIWKNISQASDSPLLNRATQGLYPPGSTIKIMIAEAALSEHIVALNDTFNCTGVLKIGPDYTLQEDKAKAHGTVNIKQALAVSCNITFGSLAIDLGRSRLAKTFEKYGFNKPLSEEIQENASHLPDFSKLGNGDLAQTGIGQGSLLVTPLRMAMLAGCYANNGTVMQPYLVKQITAPDGTIIKRFEPNIWLTPATPQIAGELRQMMVAVVQEGTGASAQIPGITVAGKTGTAENPHGPSHAWFIGFAPADDPQIAIAVIVENGGSGGGIAAPIARQIIREAIR